MDTKQQSHNPEVDIPLPITVGRMV